MTVGGGVALPDFTNPQVHPAGCQAIGLSRGITTPAGTEARGNQNAPSNAAMTPNQM